MRKAVLLLVLAAGLASAYSLYDPPRLVPRVDYSLGLVFLERWRGDYFIEVEQVLPISEYLDYQLAQSVREAWQEEAKRNRQKQELAADASGLIPDIQLPKLPIFGEGSKIDISGKDRITLGGRQTFVRSGVQSLGTSSLFPELKMEQQLSVTLKGTIGERTKVNIDHDSERQESQNKVVLSYTGTEDDIIQSVELGDTRLTIPSTGYTGDLPAHHGLFGASAKGKVGGVDVYAIASREESQSQTQSFTGRRRVSIDTIYAYRYVPRRFYYVDAPGTISNLRVYVDDRNPSNNQGKTYEAIATVFPDSPDSLPANWTYDRAPGDFDLKSLGKDYFLQPGNIIEFARALDQSDVVGLVIFVGDDTIGGKMWHDSLVLKMLKPEMPDSLSLTWDYEQRNVYSLLRDSVSLSSLRLFRDEPDAADVEYEDAGANSGRKFLELLGLDPNGDGRVEYPEFEGKTGLIRFPGSRPFDTSALSERDRVIYRRDPVSLRIGEGIKYYMVAEYSSAAESYYLGQPDIEVNTEKVIVNGERWTKDSDYTIDYASGVLAFIRALPPDADIQVTYEYSPLFSISQKSLVGARAEWAASQQGKVGTSVFYRSEGSQDDKPSLGSEPFSRMIAETDASYTVNSDGVSAFLDRLPLLRAQATSSFSASAEGAVSLPNPNTKGVAYLDDFSGTSITRDVSIAPLLWSWGSVPVGKDTTNFARVRLNWVRPEVRVRNDSVFGPTGEDQDLERHDVLRVMFTPDSGDRQSWAGMMTSAAQSGMSMNLSEVEDLRMILKSRSSTGTIHVTVGMSIDEDVPRRNRAGAIVGLDGRKNTEDRNANGVLDADLQEDTGLDTVFGSDSLWGRPDTSDDGNDDYDPDTNPTGMEGNNYLDAEDLDRNEFSRYNHYFECDIPLSDGRYFTDLVNGWKLCRISLHDSVNFRTVGQPKWEDIRLVRVWFDDFAGPDTIDFYSIEFIGSRWGDPFLTSVRDTGRLPGHAPSDTTEKVWTTQISRKTDTSYTPPFQLKRDVSGNVEDEAALLLGYQNLHGYRRAAVSKTSADREDYRQYSDLRMYVHDDGNGLAFLLRLGADSLNYYEYVAPVTSGALVPGRDGKWYEFVIPLDSFPILKLQRDEARVPPTALWSSGPYRMLGTPSLADVRLTALGIEHPGSAKISGGLWFNDLRLTAPRSDAGYGFQARTNLALSDFVTLAVNYGYSDPNFRRFSEDRRLKTTGFATSLGASVRANLDRLLPQSWGLSLPLGYSVSDQRDVPRFSPQYADLYLPKELASSRAYVATGRSEEFFLDNVRKQKSGNPWLNYTVEGMALSWRDRRGRTSTPLQKDSSWASTVRWVYAVSPDLKVDIGPDNELALFPQDLRFGVTDGRQRSYRGTRVSLDSTFRTDTTLGHDLATEFGVDYSPIEDLTFGYDVETERDLLVPSPDTFWFLTTGTEAGREHGFQAGYNLEIADAITPGIDFNGDYTDSRTLVGSGYSEYRNMDNSGELEFTLGTDLSELLGRLEPEGPQEEKAAGVPPPRPESDTLRPDSLTPEDTAPEAERPSPSRQSPLNALRQGASKLGRVIEPVEISYSISRTSDLVGVYDAAPWHYRLGLSDIFTFDSTNLPSSANRERRNTLRASTGGRIRDLSARVSYQWSEGKDLSNIFQSATMDRSTTWPEIELTQGKLHTLFKKWATDSKLTASYRRRRDLSGEYVRYTVAGDTVESESLRMIGRNETEANEFSPLLSWSTTWKKRVSTTLSANYSFGAATSFLDDAGAERSITHSTERSVNLSLSYAFSAPQGLRLPLLGKLRLSSDLSLTWSLRASQNHRWLESWIGGVPSDETSNLQLDNQFGTSLAASYRFSRSIEAGLNTGYSQNRGLSATTTQSMDLNLWVLFRF